MRGVDEYIGLKLEALEWGVTLLQKFGAPVPDQTKPGATIPVAGTLRPNFVFSGSELPNYEGPPNNGGTNEERFPSIADSSVCLSICD
jgi:hypothetical protein